MKIAKVTFERNVELFKSVREAAEDAGISRWSFSRRLKKAGKVTILGNTYSEPIER